MAMALKGVGRIAVFHVTDFHLSALAAGTGSCFGTVLTVVVCRIARTCPVVFRLAGLLLRIRPDAVVQAFPLLRNVINVTDSAVGIAAGEP